MLWIFDLDATRIFHYLRFERGPPCWRVGAELLMRTMVLSWLLIAHRPMPDLGVDTVHLPPWMGGAVPPAPGRIEMRLLDGDWSPNLPWYEDRDWGAHTMVGIANVSVLPLPPTRIEDLAAVAALDLPPFVDRWSLLWVLSLCRSLDGVADGRERPPHLKLLMGCYRLLRFGDFCLAHRC
ncbi:hypothetical protein ACLOJK_022338 [Asimina triloba]